VYRHGYAPPGKQKSDWDGPVAEEALTGDGSRHGLIGTLVPHSCWLPDLPVVVVSRPA